MEEVRPRRGRDARAGDGDLLATGWGSAVAAQVSNVFVANDAAHPVPVHEQGTANVNVTNSSLSVTQAAITGGGLIDGLATGEPEPLEGTATASALSIHMTDGVTAVDLLYGNQIPAAFAGPGNGFPGNSSIELALTRPIKFDAVQCQGTAGACSVSWIGTQP